MIREGQGTDEQWYKLPYLHSTKQSTPGKQLECNEKRELIAVFGQDGLVISSMAALNSAACELQVLSCLEESADPVPGP